MTIVSACTAPSAPAITSRVTRREQLQELHLALEGAVDQMARAHRLCSEGEHGLDQLDRRLDAAFADIAALRNHVREALMKELAKPAALPTIRSGKD